MISKTRMTFKGIACLTALAVIITGCATPGQAPVGTPVAGGQVGCGMQETSQTNNTLSGALIGGGAGAVLGAAAGGRTRSAVTGAAVGALVGGAIGAYMDQQETALRTDLAGSGIKMARSGDAIILTLPEGILFASGKSALSSKAKQSLNRLAGSLVRFEKTTVSVCGHTDSVGSHAMNSKLSTDRARSVSNYLTAKGVPAHRLNFFGFADDHPLADNGTASGRAQNRRVEIVLNPIKG